MRLSLRQTRIGIFLTLLLASAPGFGDTAPPPAASAPSSQTSAQELVAPVAKRAWELDAAMFTSLGGQSSGQIGAARLLVRHFFTDSMSIGLDLRYWPSGSYPLAASNASSAWAAGAAGQLYLFRTPRFGAYVGGSFLWVPTVADMTFAPEVGAKWFATQRVAVGISYWLLTDLGSYTTSFEPPFTGRSRQALGLELSVFL